ncbi:MAG TPA: sialidase family protein [Pirellulales bacterium]|jgi:hypothetical protein|nr:sialidase family protein [Pirellulales bacterium]
MKAIRLGFCAPVFICSCAAAALAADVVGIAPAKDLPGAQQPQLAVSPGGTIYMAFGSGNSIFCTSSASGTRFEPPKKIGESGVMALGMRRGPRIAASEKSVVVTAVVGEQGHGRDGDLLAWHSSSGGDHWSGPVKINTVPGSAREGLHHLTVAPDGTFYCVWLDLREKTAQVYGAASGDGGETWHDEKMIYRSPEGPVCQCCQPQATFDRDGGLHVMWRNNLAGARDMYLANSGDNGRSFDRAKKLGRGTWPLNACPMDGGGIACDTDGTVHTIWRRDHDLYSCTPGKMELPLGRGQQGWAASGPGGVYFIWIERRPGAVMLLPPHADAPVKLADAASDPVIAGPVNGMGPIVAAWQTDSSDGDRIQATVLTRRK